MNYPLFSGLRSTKISGRSQHGYTLLTGATGLVGQFLLKELLIRGVRVAVLARNDRRHSAHQRVEAILQRWERELGFQMPRPMVLCGEVQHPQLGLSMEEFRWLREHCNSVIHNAAVVTFEGDDRNSDPWATNVQGTEHVLNLLNSLGIDEFHYVSTAYVCGDRSGLILESELDCGQRFRNAYEESKFLAEKKVRELSSEISTTIYRPSIIAGDSQTGFTCSYHGLMLYLRLIDLLVPQQPRQADGRVHTPIELPVHGDEPHDIVTVDFVAEAIARLFCKPEAHGYTYHLSAEIPTTFRGVIDVCCHYYNSCGVSYKGEGESIPPNSEFAQRFSEQSRVYQSYNRCLTHFDQTNLRKQLPNLKSPVIDEQMIHRFLEFGRRDRWGKRRHRVPEFSEMTEQRLLELIAVLPEENRLQTGALGIDVIGPGGSQWTVVFEQGQVRRIEKGIMGLTTQIVECRPIAVPADYR